MSSLNTDSRVYTRAIRNVNDGLSLLNIGDAAVGELSSIVTRMRELTEQSANGTYTLSQRGAMDDEAQALSKEYSRISRSANFNGLRLFDGSLEGGIRLQAGYGIDGSVQGSLGKGLGTGTFGAKATYATQTGNVYDTPNESRAVAAGDVNGDGVLDLVTAGIIYSGGIYWGQASVFIGRGDGTFGGKTDYTVHDGGGWSEANALALGDVNGDGILDMVTAGWGDNQSQVSLRLGRGDGSFADSTTYAMDGTALALGDINGDGFLDLVTAGRHASQGQSSVRLGRGDGTFGNRVTYATETGGVSGSSNAVGLGDMNNDGILDLVTAGYSRGAQYQGQATVLLGRGDGSFAGKFTCATETGSVGGRSRGLSLGDVNGDGMLDLVTAGDAQSGSQQGQATVLIGRGDGTLAASATYATETGGNGSLSNAISLRDLNGDSILDMVTVGKAISGAWKGQASVLLGRGDGTFGGKVAFTTAEHAAGGESFALALGDMNGDGVFDLTTAGYTKEGYGQGQASVLPGIVRDGIAPILSFSLRSMADARQAMGLLDRKLDSLSAQRGVLGAFQSRLHVAVNNLSVSRENFQAAGGRIKDADVAAESSSLVRTQILQQAASSVLAQANQQPAIAIQLLAG